jgi:methyl-accepting chemotaxis protein
MICAAMPESELSSSSAFIDKYAKDAFDSFVQTQKIAKTGYYYVVDTKGKMLNHPDKKLIGKDFSKEKFMQNILSKKTGAERYIWNGKKKLVGFAYLDSVGAILVGGANMGELVGSIKRDIISKTMIVGLIVIAVATVLINMLINRTIVMPIIKLGDFIEKSFRRRPDSRGKTDAQRRGGEYR